jgi:exosome complex component RRP45
MGHVEVALGKTRSVFLSPWIHNMRGLMENVNRVMAHVEATMIKPASERPYEGVLNVHAELGPMAGIEYEPGRCVHILISDLSRSRGQNSPSDDEVALSRMLDKVLRRSDALDRESLCILAGQRVWSVRLTLHILSSSGNVLDVAVLAGVAALRHFRRPEVEVVGDEVIVHPAESRAPVPLAFHHSPYSLTFALYTVPTGETKGEGRVVALLDPAGLEATLAQGTLSVALNAQKELCVVHKGVLSTRSPPVCVLELMTSTAGGVALSPQEVMQLVQVAVVEVQALDKTISKALDEDWKERKARVEVR